MVGVRTGPSLQPFRACRAALHMPETGQMERRGMVLELEVIAQPRGCLGPPPWGALPSRYHLSPKPLILLSWRLIASQICNLEVLGAERSSRSRGAIPAGCAACSRSNPALTPILPRRDPEIPIRVRVRATPGGGVDALGAGKSRRKCGGIPQGDYLRRRIFGDYLRNNRSRGRPRSLLALVIARSNRALRFGVSSSSFSIQRRN